MERLYTYKFRLYPTKSQEVYINKHFGCCRYVYNYFLDKLKGKVPVDVISSLSGNNSNLGGFSCE